MKVKSVKTNSSTWYELKTPVKVQTSNGVQEQTRFFFNGFNPTLVIHFNDDRKLVGTYNHQLMVEGIWRRLDEIQVGDKLADDIVVVDITEGDIQPTMDMEVPEEHHYILENGVKSHNSSFILGAVSPSIEPLAANYFVKNLAKGSFTYRNPYLQKVLEAHGKDTDEVWDTILDNYGSVQHLEFLTDHERDVFKTFAEITPMTIIQQAAARQKWIDQSQSLNLMIPPDAPMKDVSTLLIEAWKMGVKTIYYNRSTGNAAQKLVKDILSCASCEA